MGSSHDIAGLRALLGELLAESAEIEQAPSKGFQDSAERCGWANALRYVVAEVQAIIGDADEGSAD